MFKIHSASECGLAKEWWYFTTNMLMSFFSWGSRNLKSLDLRGSFGSAIKMSIIWKKTTRCTLFWIPRMWDMKEVKGRLIFCYYFCYAWCYRRIQRSYIAHRKMIYLQFKTIPYFLFVQHRFKSSRSICLYASFIERNLEPSLAYIILTEIVAIHYHVWIIYLFS